MSTEAELGGAVGAAITGGGIFSLGHMIDGIEDAIEQGHISSATAGSGDVAVELEKLVDFYNTLSGIHEDLQKQMATIKGDASSIHGTDAGGSVSGVKAAWQAIAESSGVVAGAPSLYGNMSAIDDLVLSHMVALKQNVDAYAAQENYAVEGLGKAASSGTGAAPAPVSHSTTAGTPVGAGRVHAI